MVRIAISAKNALVASQSLAGAGLGEAHQMLDLEIVFQLSRVLHRKLFVFLTLDEVGDAILGILGRTEIDDVLRRRSGCDEIDELFVS